MAKFPVSAPELHEFIDILFDESERGSVLVTVAAIENCLRAALKAEFKRRSDISSDEVAALLGPGKMPPIGSFWARTSLAHALGLVERSTQKALEILRPIRNDAAHLGEAFSLRKHSQELVQMVDCLSASERALAKLFGLMGVVQGPSGIGEEEHKARVDFFMVTIILYLRILDIEHCQGRPHKEKADAIWEVYADVIREEIKKHDRAHQTR